MRRRRVRLALWIYLAGVAQFAAVAAGFVLLLEVRAGWESARQREARAAVDAVAAVLGDAAAVRRELERVEREQGATITIHDERGRVLATNRRPGDLPRRQVSHGFGLAPGSWPQEPPGGLPLRLVRRPESEPRVPPRVAATDPAWPPGPLLSRPAPPQGPVPAFVMPVTLRDGSVGRGVYALRDGPKPWQDGLVILALVLGAVGVVSWLTARSLTRPLAQLSSVARAFGGGALNARANLARADEIGDVAKAFDEMADRVAVLLRAEKELLANVSHELRTPLSRIRVALEIAEEGDAKTACEALADITRDLGELERLIGDVLTAARLDLDPDPSGHGIPPLRRELVELAGVLDSAASRFRAAHPERKLVVSLPPELPAILGDRVLLRRAFDNLLENAHKYSPRPESEVELRAQLSGEDVEVTIRDQGMGIAPEDLPHVFRPFFRVDRSRTRATGGLGLGLALARRVIEAHGGTIAIESRLEHGTRAVVALRGGVGAP